MLPLQEWISSFVSYFRFHVKVISYGICLSLLDLFSMIISSCICVAAKMALFHSFLLLSSIPLCIFIYVCVCIPHLLYSRNITVSQEQEPDFIELMANYFLKFNSSLWIVRYFLLKTCRKL